MSSPYLGLEADQWLEKTKELIFVHPLDCKEIVEVTLDCWDAIFKTVVGGKAQIGVHIFPRPQVMGTFIHELVPLELSWRYPELWRREQSAGEKDLVYVPDRNFSVEIKTSSHKSQIFGNRSYAQPTGARKKQRFGYFLTANFEKFAAASARTPRILRICFGWLDDDDWIGQTAQTGQQARLPGQIYGRKLLAIYSV